MLFYTAILERDESVYEREDKAEYGRKTSDFEYNRDEINHFVGNCKNNPVIDFYVDKERQGKRKIAFACNRVNFSMETILTRLAALVKQKTGFDYILRDVKEILASEYEEMCEVNSREDKLGLYCYNSNSIVEHFSGDSHNDCSLNRRDKLCLLVNADLEAEVQRIASPKNKKVFLGSFLHYIIKTDIEENSQNMLQVLLGTLYANKRLLSRKYVELKFSNRSIFFNSDFKDVIQLTSGATVVFNFIGLTDINSELEELQDIVSRYSKDVLFVFLIDRDNNDLDDIHESINIKTLVINDGTDSRNNALRYINNEIGSSKLAEYASEEVEKFLPDKQHYAYKDILKAYNDYQDSIIVQHFYCGYLDDNSAYKEKSIVEQALSAKSCYMELDKIIGLEAVKTLLRRIIAVTQYNKCREKAKLVVTRQGMHMCFRGNPGTAKTTMARLLGKILKAEGVLSTGVFVECGRADLVGKYVGWTAPAVKRKFAEAQGGVLFIDEAYSLVEDRNSFATEAINTIIAEMENHRDDVLVIFAGYPDKMEAFLNMNEGLRSRVPYHIDFPDYSINELIEILQVMAEQQGYCLTAEAKADVKTILSETVKQEDFGNGRYVRNMLEKAIMKHAEKVMNYGQELSEQQMTVLEAEDFEEEKIVPPVRGCRKIGFGVECI